MARVKRLAGQGAQNIGAEVVSRVPVGITPFQNINAPLLDGNAKTLMKAGDFGMEATKSIAAFSNKVTQDAYDAQTLIWQDNLKNGGADLTANYRNPEHANAAMGLKADGKWMADEMGRFKDGTEKITKSQEYKDLSAENKNALDAQISAQRNSHRAKAMQWMEQQNNAAVEGARDTNITTAESMFSADTTTTGSTAQGLANAVVTKFAKKGLSEEDVHGEVRSRLDAALSANIDNIAKDPAIADKVAVMEDVLKKGSMVTVAGKTVEISPLMRKELKTKIALQKSAEKNATQAAKLAVEYGPENVVAAQKKVDGMAIPQADKDNIMDRLRNRHGLVTAQQRQQDHNTELELSKSAAKAEALDEVAMGRLSGPKQSALRTTHALAQERLANKDHDRPTHYEKLGPDGKLVGGLNHWLAQETTERAAMSEEQLVNTYKKDLSGKDWSGVVNEWRSAREAQGKVAGSLYTADVKAQAAVQKEQATFFDKLVKDSALVAGVTKSSHKDIAATIKTELRKEFRELNDGREIKTVEMESLIKAATLRVALKSGEVFGAQLRQASQAGLTDDDRSGAFNAIPSKDRVDYLGLYARQNKVPQGEGAKMTDFNIWLAKFNKQTVTAYNKQTNPFGMTPKIRTDIIKGWQQAHRITPGAGAAEPDALTITKLHRLKLVRSN